MWRRMRRIMPIRSGFFQKNFKNVFFFIGGSHSVITLYCYTPEKQLREVQYESGKRFG